MHSNITTEFRGTVVPYIASVLQAGNSPLLELQLLWSHWWASYSVIYSVDYSVDYSVVYSVSLADEVLYRRAS